MATSLTTLPKGKLKPVVIRKEIVEKTLEPKIERVVTLPSITSYKESIDPSQVVEMLKNDPDFLEKIKGEKGEKGDPGLGAGGGEGAVQRFDTVNYIEITTQTYYLKKRQVISGINILGQSYNGESTIYLPRKLFRNALIEIKDETGNNNTINIEVYDE